MTRRAPRACLGGVTLFVGSSGLLVAASACGPEPAPKAPDSLATPSVPPRVGLVPIRADGSCPSGSDWNGAACVPKQVVTQVVCSAGSKLEKGACVAAVNASCPAGTRLEAGRSCVAIQVDSPSSSPAPGPQTQPASGRGPAMVSIPSGSFQMGSRDGYDDEKPAHQVRVGAFSMDATEVTTSQYEACVRGGSCPAAGTGDYCNAGKRDRLDHPINCVSWDDATAFCQWSGKRLPTEEEWEYAARGSDGRKYPWGDHAPGLQLCWNRWSSGQGTCAVGSMEGSDSPFALQDMAGNVSEWAASDYCPYSSSGRTKCAEAATVIRGGSWDFDIPSNVRSAVRTGSPRATRSNAVGFRCAR